MRRLKVELKHAMKERDGLKNARWTLPVRVGKVPLECWAPRQLLGATAVVHKGWSADTNGIAAAPVSYEC
jgi:hypothetical protein